MSDSSGKNRARGAIILVLLAVAAAGLLAWMQNFTEERIAANELAEQLRALRFVLPEDGYDNAPHLDIIEVASEGLLGTTDALPVYRARLSSTPVAVVLTAVAPNGYSGEIRLLVGIDMDGHIIGVRIVEHKETPGLGDRIEADKSDWILSFTGLDVADPLDGKWQLKRDGGEFDQLSGATVTSRAVTNAVRDALLYFNANRTNLTAPAPPSATPEDNPAG